MKVGSKLQFEVPDNCPPDCDYKDDFRNYGQSAICGHCPVFVCRETKYDGKMISMVGPTHYRDDWAKEWEQFFKDGTHPCLPLKRAGVCDHSIQSWTKRDGHMFCDDCGSEIEQHEDGFWYKITRT